MKKTPTIGIRREDKNVWERRTPLVPSDCYKLKELGARIIVQPCKLRCFTDKQYYHAGCEIKEDLSECDLIIAVKEVPVDKLISQKTYLFFSHVIKGQKDNMPLLKTILSKNIRLIDYECIRDETDIHSGSSRFAGIVGTIDLLQGLGNFLLHKKLMTPFIFSGMSYMYDSLENAKNSVKKMGEIIKTQGLPIEICPFIFGITSLGVASNGVLEILSLLPHEIILPDKIGILVDECRKDKRRIKTNIVYISQISHKYMYKHKFNNEPFEKKDFYKNPQNYKSIFAENLIPYLSALFHCIYWEEKFPKLLSLSAAKQLTDENKFRIQGICDVTCDVNGSIELLQKHTTIDHPFYYISTNDFTIVDDINAINQHSVLYQALDHLPCELPVDSSEAFSSMLYKVVREIVLSWKENDFKDLPKHIRDACITSNGKLNDNFKYLYKYLEKV